MCKLELIHKILTYVQAIDSQYKSSIIDENLAEIKEKLVTIQSAVQQEDLAESALDYDIIPELFDPLICDLLKDPVISPVSGYIYSRKTISDSFLNDPDKDPISRQPLHFEDCKDHLPSKAAIKWFMKKATNGEDYSVDWKQTDKKFADALTGSILVDPVQLPSGNYVSMQTILDRNLTEDPFTNEPIDRNKIAVDSEMKLVVEWYNFWVKRHEDD